MTRSSQTTSYGWLFENTQEHSVQRFDELPQTAHWVSMQKNELIELIEKE
jgi:hypothetical protein